MSAHDNGLSLVIFGAGLVLGMYLGFAVEEHVWRQRLVDNPALIKAITNEVLAGREVEAAKK